MELSNSNNPTARTLLILSYYFPPYAGVSVVRTQKHCKLLPGFGWNPWVLSVSPRYYGTKIIAMPDGDLDRTRIFRIPFIRFPGNTVVLKLLFPLIAVIFAVANFRKIDAIYISGSPFYLFPVTSIFTPIMGIPSVLDFRDSWSFNHGYDGRKSSTVFLRVRQFVFGLAEKIAIKYATHVIFASPALRDEYAAFIPYHQRKYSVIHNGFDPDDFSRIAPRKICSHRTLTLILAGQMTVYTPEVLDGLLAIIGEISDLHFLYIGSEHNIVSQKAARYHAESQVTSFSYMPYHTALEYVAGSEYAMVTAGLKNQLCTKIFDYIALNKPILCFVPENSVITSTFGGLKSMVVSKAPHTLDSIRQGLKSVMEVFSVQHNLDLSRFTRQRSSEELARVLNQITSSDTSQYGSTVS